MQSVLLKPVDTRVLKGIAILLMLTHHLFYNDSMNGMFGEVSLFGVRVVHEIGLWSKVCVTIFVLLSGYGLEVTSKGKVIHLLDFYKHRFKKLMINYWFVWILTVPIGIFVFGHSLNGVYGNHIVIKCILDFFGLINFTGSYGYNPTWWFYSCIIAMYLLFPLFHVMSDGLGGANVFAYVGRSLAYIFAFFNFLFGTCCQLYSTIFSRHLVSKATCQ